MSKPRSIKIKWPIAWRYKSKRSTSGNPLNFWLRLIWLWLIVVVLNSCDTSQQTFEPIDLNGKKIETQGQLLLINYWAEWCAPCREEIPELNRFASEQQGKVVVVGVNYDQLPPLQVQAQAEKLGIAFASLPQDPAAHWGQTRPQVLPSTLLINASGHWQTTLIGPQTKQSLQAAIKAANRHPAADKTPEA
ncbi:MAG: TlpA family protein disulfide reductase [Gammaproteobacteria bacterium]|nr:TlpA family protein disulfide reductase [Gammaproteobacteria bacterium]